MLITEYLSKRPNCVPRWYLLHKIPEQQRTAGDLNFI